MVCLIGFYENLENVPGAQIRKVGFKQIKPLKFEGENFISKIESISRHICCWFITDLINMSLYESTISI